MRKTLGIVLMALGALCLICALSLMWYEKYSEKKAMLAIEQAVRDHVFVVSKDSGAVNSEAPVDVEELEDLISAVDGDQEVAEVVTYKNVLDIPKIECQAYIGEGTTAYNLARGVGHHSETVKVGGVGNCVIAGHASRSYKCIFNRLEEMQVLDQFYAYDAAGEKHTYHIIRRFVCPPNQLSILDNTDDGRSTITIYTCTEGGTMRFVLVGTEFTDEGLAEFKETYYGDKISHMRTLNSNVSIEDVTKLIDLRSTKRTYIDTSGIILRPWVGGDAATSDMNVLAFGVSQAKGVAEDDAT